MIRINMEVAMNWIPLQKLIPQTAGKYNFATSLKAIEVCQAYRSVAPALLPAEVLENTFAKSYQNGVLTLAAYDSLWAQQLHMKKHLLQEQINQRFHPSVQDEQKFSHKLQVSQKVVQNIKIVIAEKREELNDV